MIAQHTCTCSKLSENYSNCVHILKKMAVSFLSFLIINPLPGETKYKFPCLSGHCESEFTLSTLKKALSANVFSNLLRKVQEEEIRQAGIPNLVACPFCSFATIMENPDDKIFRCQNPSCLRESCRCVLPN